jgi:putative ABC transport system permease protein
MQASDAFLFALNNLSSRRLRTGLSTLGMMFGVAAVIAMLSIGAGAERQALAVIERLGLHNILIRAKEVPSNERTEVRKKWMGLSNRVAVAIREAVPHIVSVSPKAKLTPHKIIGEGYKTTGSVYGVSPQHIEVTRLALAEGRFIDDLDERTHAQVCVIAANVRRDLFVTGPALDRYIKVNDVWLRVVGVLAADRLTAHDSPQVSGSESDSEIYVPMSTLLQKFDRDPLEPPLVELVVRLDGQVAANDVAAQIRSLLAQLAAGAEDYELLIPAALLAQRQETQRIFSIVMGCIAGISLLVGGIGIMNIMLASVFEQTREIGVRRAVGALQRDILVQFLVESFLVASTGGLLGVLLGVAISSAVASYANWPTVITPLAVLLATGVSGLVGLFSGLYPALRASRLDPILALQHS